MLIWSRLMHSNSVVRLRSSNYVHRLQTASSYYSYYIKPFEKFQIYAYYIYISKRSSYCGEGQIGEMTLSYCSVLGGISNLKTIRNRQRICKLLDNQISYVRTYISYKTFMYITGGGGNFPGPHILHSQLVPSVSIIFSVIASK